MNEKTKLAESSNQKCLDENEEWREKYESTCLFLVELLIPMCFEPLESHLKPCDRLFNEEMCDAGVECQSQVDAQGMKQEEI